MRPVQQLFVKEGPCAFAPCCLNGTAAVVLQALDAIKRLTVDG